MLDIINVSKSFNKGTPIQKNALIGLNLTLDRVLFCYSDRRQRRRKVNHAQCSCRRI